MHYCITSTTRQLIFSNNNSAHAHHFALPQSWSNAASPSDLSLSLRNQIAYHTHDTKTSVQLLLFSPDAFGSGEIGFIFDICLFSGVVTVIAWRKPHQLSPRWYYFAKETKPDVSQATSTHHNQRVGRKIKETAPNIRLVTMIYWKRVQCFRREVCIGMHEI